MRSILRRGLLALLLLAGGTASPVAAAPTPLAGFSFSEIVYDRNRLIQGSVVVVGLGIALLWMGKK